MIAAMISQPAAFRPVAAYNPIEFRVQVHNDTMVWADIYFNDVFYKSIATTSPATLTPRTFKLDIQGVCQEYLRSNPPRPAYGFQQDNTGIAKCYVRFRGTDNFVIIGNAQIPLPPIPSPTQGTMESAPVSAGGYQSNTFYVLNSALQLEDEQNFWDHLFFFGAGAYGEFRTLSHRPDGYRIGREDNDHIAVYAGNNLGNGQNTNHFLYRVTDLDTGAQYNYMQWLNLQSQVVTLSRNTVTNIPVGPKSIQTHLISGSPAPWASIRNYRISLHPISATAQIAWQSPRFEIVRNCDQECRVRFANHLGFFDAITFTEYEEQLVTKSGTAERYAGTPRIGHKLTARRKMRTSVTSVKERKAIGYFPETQLPWIEELFSSPVAFMEWKGNQSKAGWRFQGQPDDMLPIVIKDFDAILHKTEDRYEYQVVITFERPEKNIQRS